MSGRPTQIISILAIAGYLAAAALPCPIQTETTSAASNAASYSHTDHDHSVANEAVSSGGLSSSTAPSLSEPCLCGCQAKSGGTLSAKRLGRAIPSEIESVVITPPPRIHTPLRQAAPQLAAAPPELVPILS
jgi:hypothetical protein